MTPEVHVQLQRLWKGTLFIGIAGGYTLLVASLFVFHGWRPALLAVFFIVLSQFFRYIANEVDRIGWQLRNAPDSLSAEKGRKVGATTTRFQTRMLYLLLGLAQLQNLALACQAYVLADAVWALATVVGLAVIEILYGLVRRVNRRVDFEEASYGFRDRSVLRDGAEAIDASAQAKEAKLAQKLGRLKQLADEGLISERAYRKACDKLRIDHIVRDDASHRSGKPR